MKTTKKRTDKTMNKTMMRGLLATLATGLLFSCKLDEELPSVYTPDNAFETQANAQEAVNGIYAYLKGATHAGLFYLNDMATDACYKTGIDFEFLNESNLTNHVDVARPYNSNWQMIGTANVAIDNITLMDNSAFTDSKKIQLLGEARFMRAFAYYQLTDMFYRIPLITNGYHNSAARLSLATVEELDDQIEADLLVAASSLPVSWPTSEGQRPTAGAAEGYLMRLHMRKAGRLREQGKDAAPSWTAALNYADNVIASGRYALQPTVWDVFDPTSEASLYNNEIIFAVRSAGATLPLGSYDMALYFTPWDYGFGWDIFNVPLSLYWKFHPDDQRFTELIVHDYPNVYGDDIQYTAPPSINEVGTIDDESGSPRVVELGQVYTEKYFYERRGTYNYSTPNNLPLLRYADVLLCRAEILNELNGVNQPAVDLLNEVRERAFGNSAHNYAIGDFATQGDFRSALCDERLFEFNNEGVRRQDLIRMGLWKDWMDAYMDGIKAQAEKREQNTGAAPGTLSSVYSIYPKFSGNPLKKHDKRRYYPIPGVYTNRYPNLADNRDFPEE